MIFWEGDFLLFPGYNWEYGVNYDEYIFRDWTNYLQNTTDLFYANGTISSSKING